MADEMDDQEVDEMEVDAVDDPDEVESEEGPGDESYFIMTCEGIHPPTTARIVSEWNGPPWMTGEVIETEVPNPFVFRLDPHYPGDLMPMYEGTILLMRDDLVSALHEAGVDNLQLFPAVVRDEEKNKEYLNYKAVNIVGVISCANMEASERMDADDESEIINVDFDSLVIDESKTGGALLFRLAESVGAIVVHRTIRSRVEALRGMTFYGSGEWSG